MIKYNKFSRKTTLQHPSTRLWTVNQEPLDVLGKTEVKVEIEGTTHK